MKNSQFSAVILILLFGTAIVNAGLVAGRSIPRDRNAGITLKMGQIANFEASVKDESRGSGFLRQDFSLEDFGIDGGYVTYGLSADKAWKFFGIQLDLLYLGISEDITAQHSYNINVDSIGFNGADYLHVAANTDVNAEFTGGILELTGVITPLSFALSENVSFSPWVSFGLMVMGGDYDIDNGKTTATVSYGPLSETYAVGGSASGPVGFIVPEIGFGGEIRIGVEDDFNFVLNANYSVLPMGEELGQLLSEQDGSTDVTIDYSNLKINGSLEIPRGNGKAWVVGIQYESIDASADTDLDNNLFHKSMSFNMEIITGSVGLRF